MIRKKKIKVRPDSELFKKLVELELVLPRFDSKNEYEVEYLIKLPLAIRQTLY
jgi:hypothetical protein